MDHWLYTERRPLTKREAWENILLTVNYEPSKVLIRGQVYECGRGQSLLSLNSWADQFMWSIKQVRTFFSMLENDNMIITEGLQYTTRLSVCNYDTYQDKGHTEGTPRANEGHTEGTPRATIKEEEEIKEIKESISWRNSFEIYLEELRSEYKELINDPEFILNQEKFHPNIDIKLSLEKACVNYWATEAGWKKKKSERKTKNINWKSTLTNAIDLNKVYKPRDFSSGQAKQETEISKMYKKV